MPKRRINHQLRPDSIQPHLSDLQNSVEYGLLRALDALPNSYPDPVSPRWLRNRGRAAITVATFLNAGTWPSENVVSASLRNLSHTDDDSPIKCISPKLACILVGLPMATLKHYPGFGLHQDRRMKQFKLRARPEDFTPKSLQERKLGTDHLRELVARFNNEPSPIRLRRTFQEELLFLPPTCALIPHEDEATEYAINYGEWGTDYLPPLGSADPLRISRVSGIPVSSFVRYAEVDYDRRGFTYMTSSTLEELIMLFHEDGRTHLADELDAMGAVLPSPRVFSMPAAIG